MSTTNINNWFSSVKYFPDWGYRLRRLLSGTIGLCATSTFGKDIPHIQWEPIDSGYADHDANKIAIGMNILSEDISKRPNKAASKEEAIVAVLGVVVHEFGHFLYSPKALPHFMNPGMPKNDEIAFTIANIVEDLFIEDQMIKRERFTGWMIAGSWEYFFGREDCEKRFAKWDGKSLEDLNAVLNTAIAWKNLDVVAPIRSDFEQELYDMFLSVHGMTNLQDRMDLIEKIYRFLIEEQESQGFSQESQNGEEGEKGEGQGQKAKGDPTKEARGIDGEIYELGKPASARSEDALAIWDRNRMKDFSVAGGMEVGWKFPQVRGRSKVAFDNKWLKFAKWALDAGTMRIRRGNAGNYGKLTHPARLLDDGKVFSKQVVASPNGATNLTGQPQTIILADLSGSMSTPVGRGSRKEKVHAALENVQGIIEGLLLAKHKVAAYGHTTNDVNGTGNERCLIYIFKEFSETLDTASKRISDMYAMGAQSNNADSFAIEAVAKKFKNDGSPRRLIVISDGAPASYLYSGLDGIKRTKEAVDKVRRLGIQVFSLSIDEDAIAPCNEIYGTKFNFDAIDPTVIDKVIKVAMGGD